MTETRIHLDRPLPAELLRRVPGSLAAYQHYPVFSFPWLRKRSALFILAIVSFATLIGLAHASQSHDPAAGLLVAAQFALGALGMSSGGPLLATLVRSRGLAPKRERWLIMAALFCGLVLSYAIDSRTSSSIDEALRRTDPQASPAPKVAHPGALLLNIAALVAIYGLLGGGLSLRRYLRETALLADLAREDELALLRTQKDALDTRLGLLQAQIEPHFLFNTLASVRSLIATDPARAATSIDFLVDYLRATIPRLRETGVVSTLGQQLEICERYLQLMQVRMGRLSFSFEVPQALRERSFPALILVTLVENAIKHGIEPKPGPGSVSVQAIDEGSHMVVSVLDDGVGLRDGLSPGLGLSNLRDQLQTRYGADASLALESREDGGVVARITVPRLHGEA
jgi:sensor histidine kinase YesM